MQIKIRYHFKFKNLAKLTDTVLYPQRIEYYTGIKNVFSDNICWHGNYNNILSIK